QVACVSSPYSWWSCRTNCVTVDSRPRGGANTLTKVDHSKLEPPVSLSKPTPRPLVFFSLWRKKGGC
ncbi:hypothetical protein Tsubulata_046701, partial [Turnera subulata]